MKFARFMLLMFLVAGCASTQTPAQRELQQQALRENATRLRLVSTGALKADVQNLVGVASERQIYREGGSEVELWTYPHDEGYVRLKFVDSKLIDQKTHRTRLTFARDTTIPTSQKDMATHLMLSLVKLGWTKTQVEELAIKPVTKMTEQQTAELMVMFRKMMMEMKDTPLLMGIDLSEFNRDVRGEMWIYQADRLGGSLLFRNGTVVEIGFTEQPTKAQQNEIMQKAF